MRIIIRQIKFSYINAYGLIIKLNDNNPFSDAESLRYCKGGVVLDVPLLCLGFAPNKTHTKTYHLAVMYRSMGTIQKMLEIVLI